MLANVRAAALAILLLAVPVLTACADEASVRGDTRREILPGKSAAFGTIDGTIVYRDPKHAWRYARYYVKHPKSGELAEAVVALDGRALKRFQGKNETSVTTIDQKEMRFVPETVAIRAGSQVRFTNSDPQTHNISAADPRRRFSETIAKGRHAVQEFPRATGIRLPLAIGCSIHSQMQGWIYVFDHPYFRVTTADGHFHMDHVPPGKYRLEVAHAAGNLIASRTVEIKPGETTHAELILTPENCLSEK